MAEKKTSKNIPDLITFFGPADPEDLNYGLSNFSPHPVTIPSALDYFPCSKEDLVFPTAEAAFQAYKSPNDNDYVQSQVSVENPKKSKGLGRAVKLRKDWEEVKIKWMYVVVYHKFNPNPELLLKTGNAKLVEASPFDYFWGQGRSKTGSNVLGQILMIVRDQLRSGLELDQDFDPESRIKLRAGTKRKS